MLIDKATAASIEACIKQSHIEFTRLCPHGAILELNGGAACFSGSESFFSQVVGWGFATKPKHFLNDICKLESFYKTLKHQQVDVELSPFVGNELVAFMSARGYQLTEVSNVSAMDLQHYAVRDSEVEEVIIRPIQEHELDTWVQQVALGFGYPEAKEQFTLYAKAKGIRAFAAYKDDYIVAGATIAVHGRICDLGVTSTVPAFRGRGLQKKLLFARLNYAKQQGIELASVTTEPGSISDLNIQKAGFQCAYTRMKLSLAW